MAEPLRQLTETVVATVRRIVRSLKQKFARQRQLSTQPITIER